MRSGVPQRDKVRGPGSNSGHLPPPPTSFGPPASPDSKMLVSSGPPPVSREVSGMESQAETPRTTIRNAPTGAMNLGDVKANLAGGPIEAKTPKTLIREAPPGALVNEASRDPFKAGKQGGPSSSDDPVSLMRAFKSKPRSPHNPAETIQSVPFQNSPMAQGAGGVAPPPTYTMPLAGAGAGAGAGASPGMPPPGGNRRDSIPLQTQVVSGVPPKPKRGRKKPLPPTTVTVKAPRRFYENFLSCINLLLSTAILVTTVALGVVVWRLHGSQLKGMLGTPLFHVKQASRSLVGMLPFKLDL